MTFKRLIFGALALAFLGGAIAFFMADPHQRARGQSAPVGPSVEGAERPVDVVEAEPEPMHPNAPRTLFGRVTDEESEAPIAGATVTLVPAKGRKISVKTRADGQFLLRRVQPDLEALVITARGYTERRYEQPELPLERRIQWDVALVPEPTLHGVVTVDGRPVADALVRLVRPGRRLNLRGQQTDGQGRFSIRFFENGPRTLQATHSQHGQAQIEIDGPGEYSIDLPGGGWISGRVVDENNDPVERFSISASPLVRGFGGPPAQSFESADGRFVLGPLMAGEMRIWAASLGYQPGEQVGITVEPGGSVEGLVLKLKTSTVLTGVVTDARTGRPIEGAEVIPAEWKARALAESVGAWTDDDGRYRLTALPGLRTSVRIKADGYHDLLLGGVEGRPGETVVRDFALTPSDGKKSSGELTGIGAVLMPHPKGVRLGRIIEGGPAADVLDRGDVVVGIDGRNAASLGMQKVAQAIRGEEGTDVVLTVLRGGRGQPETVTLSRGRVTLPKFRRRRYRRPPADHTHEGTN